MGAIQVNDVTKRYKDVPALDHVSVTFELGKIYGFLGRNGAGKSTLINIIANRVFADSGEVLIDGIPASENMAVHDKIFCMSETDLYDRDLKVIEQFKWTKRFYTDFDMNRALTLSEKYRLDVNKRFKALSKGYQSIFKLVIALSLSVPYVIFDEPVLGLDANHRELFYSLLLEAFEEGDRTFIIATHMIEEVSNIIEEVVLIDGGRILAQESVEELLESGYSVSGAAEEVDGYCAGKNVIGYDELGGLKIAYIMGKKNALPKGSDLQISAMDLQKLFVKMTERSIK